MFNYIYKKTATLVGIKAQTHLLNQLGRYLKKAHLLDQKRLQEKGSFAEVQPRDPLIINKMLDSEGHCSGFTPLTLYALWCQQQPKQSQDENKTVVRDDFDWLMGVFDRLSKWNGDIDKLSIKDGEDFDRLLNHIEFFQNINDYVEHASQNELSESLKNTDNETIQREYAIGGMFTEKDVAFILSNIVKEDRLLLITSHNHATGLFKHDRKIFYYDSNNLFGLNKFSLSKNEAKNSDVFNEIAKLIRQSNFKKEPFFPVGFRNFSIGNVSPESYPAQADLLKQTEIIRSNNVNYRADHANGYTALTMSADMGDENSLQYYLDQGANLFDESKDGLTAFELSAIGGYVKSMEILLEKAQETPSFKIEDKHIINAVTTIGSNFEKMISIIGTRLINTDKIQNENQFSTLLNKLILSAAETNNSSLVLDLIKKGFATEAIQLKEFDKDCLYSIVKNCDASTIMTLIDNIKNSQKENIQEFFIEIAHQAALVDREDVVKRLIANEALFNYDSSLLISAKNSDKRNLFQLSLLSKEGDNVLGGLKNKLSMANINAFLFEKDASKNNVYHLAACHKNGERKIEMLNEMVLSSSSPDVKKMLCEINENGSTPFHLSVISGGKDEIKALANLANEIDRLSNGSFFSQMLTAQGTYGNTALHNAINRADIPILETLLLLAQKDQEVFNKLVTTANDGGNNCLHYSVQKTKINADLLNKIMTKLDDKILSQLLAGKNANGSTPLDLVENSVRKNPENKEIAHRLKQEMKRLGIDYSKNPDHIELSKNKLK